MKALHQNRSDATARVRLPKTLILLAEKLGVDAEDFAERVLNKVFAPSNIDPDIAAQLITSPRKPSGRVTKRKAHYYYAPAARLSHSAF